MADNDPEDMLDAWHALVMDRFLLGPRPAEILIAPGWIPDLQDQLDREAGPLGPLGSAVRVREIAFLEPGYIVVRDRYGNIIKIFGPHKEEET